MRAIRQYIGLLVAAGTLLFCTVQLVNATTSTGCDADEAACLENDVCRECINSSVDPNDITEDECSAVYPASFWRGSEGRSAGFCETSGATFCCAFDNTTVAEDCMSDAATVTYWSCLIADIGCELDDMPCYDGTDILTPAPSPTTLTAASPTVAPSSTTTTSTSTSPSSTSCDADEATCLEHDVCSECIDSSVDYADVTNDECSAIYPDAFTAGYEGFSSSFCERVGAYFCCAFDNTTVAEDCMSNAATVTYWDCLITDTGCELDDMPCYDALMVTTPAPALPTPSPTASPSSSGNVDTDESPTTASPSSLESIDTDATANGAARVWASSWVTSVGTLLVVGAAGMLT